MKRPVASAAAVAGLLLVLLAAGPAAAQRRAEVVIDVTGRAYVKTDIRLDEMDVLSGGPASARAAAMLQEVVGNDLLLSGMFRVGRREGETSFGDTLRYTHTIEGTVEGPLRDADLTGEDAPTTVSLNLLTWPERQLMLNKRYRPLPGQLRTTAHHFANEVIHMLTGEPGMCLSRIVFSRGAGDRRDLWVVDYDGEGLLRLTANRTLNLCPSWSPDGSEIAFTSYRAGQQALFSLDTATGGVREIIAEAGLNLGAAWHPDGSELAVSLSRGANPEIYRITPRGKIVQRLTVSPAIEVSPSWSPGGRDIVFTSDKTGTPQLYIIDKDGAGSRRLTFEGQYNDSAVWSPSGELIAYASREADLTQIVVMKATGEVRRVVTDRSWRNCEDPSWAPDSRHLVFASDRSGVEKLYVYDVVDEVFRQLTFGNDPDITPAWSR